MGGLGLRVDDCRKTYDELKARSVTFLQEPAARPYGVEAVMRDASGNWLVLIEPTEFTPEEMTPAVDRELSRLSGIVIPDQDGS
jgi:hypothetical protein